MHHLRRRIIGKISGFVAICAILLLSLAPAASQTIEHQRVEAMLTSICASGVSHHTPSEKHGALTHLEACGYCDLIAHAPAPPSAPRDTNASPASNAVFVAAIVSDAPHRITHRAAQPRAPPFIA